MAAANRIAFACARDSAVPQFAGGADRHPASGKCWRRLRPSPRSRAAAFKRALRSGFASAVPQHAGETLL
jgi:hypothetical protein